MVSKTAAHLLHHSYKLDDIRIYSCSDKRSVEIVCQGWWGVKMALPNFTLIIPLWQTCSFFFFWEKRKWEKMEMILEQ